MTKVNFLKYHKCFSDGPSSDSSQNSNMEYLFEPFYYSSVLHVIYYDNRDNTNIYITI